MAVFSNIEDPISSSQEIEWELFTILRVGDQGEEIWRILRALEEKRTSWITIWGVWSSNLEEKKLEKEIKLLRRSSHHLNDSTSCFVGALHESFVYLYFFRKLYDFYDHEWLTISCWLGEVNFGCDMFSWLLLCWSNLIWYYHSTVAMLDSWI